MSARERVELTLDALRALDDPAVLIGGPLTERARADAARVDETSSAELALHGVPVVVKDNIDVAGVPTTAGCPSFAYTPDVDAPAVARLRAAGAIVVGKTNLDQFATGLVGTRSPYGTPRNPFDPRIIPGGSSSGSAVAVARVLVPLALGTDTAGSGRVPAALCGIVGFKGTVGRVSARGVVPAVRRFDCTTVFARSVQDAALAMGIIGVFDEGDPWARSSPVRPPRSVAAIGVPATWPDDVVDESTRTLFERALERLDALGVELVPIEIEPFLATGELLYGGPLVAERYAAVGSALSKGHGDLDPTVAGIIAHAARWSAADAYATEYALAEARHRVAPVFAVVDALALPTTPGIATLAEVAREPRSTNERMGRFTTFVNLLDLACVAVPMGMRPDGVPAGLQLIGPAWSDDALAMVAAAFLDEPTPARTLPSTPAVPVVVVGAHLRGQALNFQLTERGGRFLQETTTAPRYRLFSMADSVPAKPALVRDDAAGVAIAVEVWALPIDQLGAFLTLVPPPLCLGTVELADGSWQKGFLCEPRALAGATEITRFGGWLAFRSLTA